MATKKAKASPATEKTGTIKTRAPGAPWPADAPERRATADLAPYAKNSRTHDAAQVDQIARSIEEFGFTNPVLIDEGGTIIAGHGRVLAAEKLGLEEVPCIVATGWTDDQKAAYVIADNKLALNAGWDEAVLSEELKRLRDADFDVTLTGFDMSEVAAMCEELAGTGKDEDSAPALEKVAVTQPGDIWILGKHRVMCGDSTSIEHADLLMDGQLADMVFTDPPYNVAYEGRGEKNKLGKIKNDDMGDDQFTQFCRDVMATAHAVMKPLACIYVCHPDSASAPKIAFESTFAEVFKKASTIIWVKQSAGMGWQDYRAQHEPILYGWKAGEGKHAFFGDRTETTVWNIGRDSQASYVHPTQKPAALPRRAIVNSCKGEDIVLDLFGGSGSTLIAAEKTGRRARLMELDPLYCDVIVRRWEEFTGQKAALVDGTTFEEASDGR